MAFAADIASIVKELLGLDVATLVFAAAAVYVLMQVYKKIKE